MRFKNRAQRQLDTFEPNSDPFTSVIGSHGFEAIEDKNLRGGGGGEPASQTVVQEQKLDPRQEAALAGAIEKSEAQFAQGPQQFFPGQTLAGIDPATQQAQQLALGQVPGLGAAGATGLETLLGGLGITSEQDPRVQAFAAAATEPLIEQFQEQIIPGIESAAIGQGAFGGTRQDLLKAEATRGLARAVGGTRADVLNRAFGQGLQQQTNLLSLLPGLQQAQLLPAQITGDVGAQREAREQAGIEAERERFEFEQQAPETSLDRLIARLTGINLGGTTTQTQTQQAAQPGRLQGALGGATTGFGLFGLPGAIGGGLLGGLLG